MQILTFQPAVLALVAVCAIAAVALSTGSSVVRNVRNRGQAKLLARALGELEQRLAEIADAVESMSSTSRSREQILDGRLTRLEQMIDTLAVETERIGEGQRHVSKLLVGRETQQQNDKPR